MDDSGSLTATGRWGVRLWVGRLSVLTCFAFTPWGYALCQQASPLTIQDALAAREFPFGVPIQLSPDGKLVAYTLQSSKAKNPEGEGSSASTTRTGLIRRFVGCDLWVANLETGEARNLTHGQGSSWGPSWSPDGRQLGFYSDRSGAQTLWLWDRANGSVRQLSETVISVLFYYFYQVPQWTPDGKQILTLILPAGVTPEQANAMLNTPQVSSKVQTYPGSTVTLYEGRSFNPKGETIQKPRGRILDLALIEVASGRVNRIFHAEAALTWYRLSPDGKRVALTNPQFSEPGKASLPKYSLNVVDLPHGQPRVVARDLAAPAVSVSWSPDGKYLAYTTYSLGVHGQSKGECFVVSPSGSERYYMTDALHANLIHYYRGPVWDPDGKAIYVLGHSNGPPRDLMPTYPDGLWRLPVPAGKNKKVASIPGHALLEVISPAAGGRFWSPGGGRSLLVVTRDPTSMKVGFYEADLSTGECRKLLEEDKSYGDVGKPVLRFDAPLGSHVMVYMAQDAGHPEDIWAMNAESWVNKRVTHTNAQFDHNLMGASRLIEWTDAEGQLLRGALLLPAGYEQGKKYPLIVYPYPGDIRSTHLNDFGLATLPGGTENMQLFATRGYAVLLPDAPVKIGQGTHLQDIAKAVMPGVDKVIKLGIADPERLGVMGVSSGGYGVLCLLVQTNRFKAAISRSGFGDLIIQYLSMLPSGASSFQAEIESFRTGGTLWEKRERFIENSPVFFLDKVETPLLLVHGSEDPSVPPARAEEIFAGLRRLGKKVQYAKYVGEGHGEADWSFANQADFLNRIVSWFDKYLKETHEPNSTVQYGRDNP